MSAALSGYRGMLLVKCGSLAQGLWLLHTGHVHVSVEMVSGDGCMRAQTARAGGPDTTKRIRCGIQSFQIGNSGLKERRDR